MRKKCMTMQLQNCTNVLPKVVSNNGILKQMEAKNLQTFMYKLHHGVVAAQ